MSTERDTHFKGFAGHLTDEIDSILHLLDNPYFVSSGMRLEVENLIAQRAYDLIYSIAEHAYTSRGLPPMVGEIHQTIKMVPDLTEWPTTAD